MRLGPKYNNSDSNEDEDPRYDNPRGSKFQLPSDKYTHSVEDTTINSRNLHNCNKIAQLSDVSPNPVNGKQCIQNVKVVKNEYYGNFMSSITQEEKQHTLAQQNEIIQRTQNPYYDK